MTHLYITGTARRSGKSALSLGFMDRLAAAGGGAAYFRPIIADVEDRVLQLMLTRYGTELEPSSHYGLLASEAHRLFADGDKKEVVKTILDRFHRLARHKRHVALRRHRFRQQPARCRSGLQSGTGQPSGLPGGRGYRRTPA